MALSSCYIARAKTPIMKTESRLPLVKLHEAIESVDDRPCDVVAVIADISFSRDGRGPLCQLGVADPSPQPYNRYRKVYFMVWERTLLDKLRITRVNSGDILFFHSIFLTQSKHRHKTEEGEMRIHRFDLYHHADGNAPVYRLGRIDHESGVYMADNVDVVPGFVRDLSDGFIQALVSENRTPGSDPAQTKERLEPPPCQCRSLLQMQSMVGIESHVMARVVKTQRAIVTTSSRSRRQRKRAAPSTVMAELTDDDNYTIPFCDGLGRFRSILEKAALDGGTVLLKHVMTQLAHQTPIRNCAVMDIVLVPTEQTTIEPCEAVCIHGTQPHGHSSPSVMLSGTEDSILSRSQQRMFLAPIRDIIIGQTPLSRNPAYLEDSSLLHALLCNEKGEYRPAIVELDVPYSQYGALSVGANMMKVLCGDIEASDWSPDGRLKDTVLGLFQGLVWERVELCWVVQNPLPDCPYDRHIAHVARVSIPVFTCERRKEAALNESRVKNEPFYQDIPVDKTLD